MNHGAAWTEHLLAELDAAKAENKRLRGRLTFQKHRANFWRNRVLAERSYVSLVCGCGRTVRGRVRKSTERTPNPVQGAGVRSEGEA